MSTVSFGSQARSEWLEKASQEPVDVLVVGGGITGAGVAREAALRGLRTLVIDKGDFASGTSSRSSKLIHGGLRYLAQGDVALVREAARERAVLRSLAPHLAKPLPMMIPAASLGGRVKLQAGLWTFEKLAGESEEPDYSVLDRSQTVKAEPHLRDDHLAGSVVFHEYLTDDARLVLETMKQAVCEGAWAASYTELVNVSPDPVGLRVDLVDRIGDSTLTVRARVVVNASGPWFDRVCGILDNAAQPLTQLTRGIHLVIPSRRFSVNHIVVLKSPDGRSTFVVPKGDVVYIGTTDTHYTGDPEEPGVSKEDAAYLLESVAATFNDAPEADDIVATWAGVRPLLSQPGKKPSEISRRHEILVGPGPVVGVAGGKLTTYRRMAERVIEKVFGLLGHGAPSVDSAKIPLVGGNAADQTRVRGEVATLSDQPLDDRLWSTYGVQAAGIIESIRAQPALAEPLGGLRNYTMAEANYSLVNEMVLTVDDLLRRRTRIGMFNGVEALSAVDDTADFLAQNLGWDDDKKNTQARDFSDLIDKELKIVRDA